MDPQLVRAARDAAVLSLISNILGQALKCHQSNKPLTLNTTDLFHFILFAMLATPPNYLWQTWLESKFPGYTENPPTESSQKDKDSKLDPSRKRLNIRNTLIKLVLDQTIAAGINNLLFIGGMSLLRGRPIGTVVRDCQERFSPLMAAGYKLWPAVSLTSFLLVPVEYRTTFGGIVGLFWGVYLSLISSSDHDH